jgi:Staphylococcal nuclease homologue
MPHRCTDGSVSSDGRLFVSPPLVWWGSTHVLALCSLLFLFTPSRAVADFSGLVVSVLDGDTIEVLHNDRPERIRLSGIDCPEKGQAYGTRAKQAASELVLGGEVTLQTYGKDKYGRTLADVLLPDWMNLNQELVKQGWCWWYRRYAPGDMVLAGRVRARSTRGAERIVGCSEAGAAVGIEEKERAVSGQAYLLALARLDSACIALNVTPRLQLLEIQRR